MRLEILGKELGELLDELGFTCGVLEQNASFNNGGRGLNGWPCSPPAYYSDDPPGRYIKTDVNYSSHCFRGIFSHCSRLRQAPPTTSAPHA